MNKIDNYEWCMAFDDPESSKVISLFLLAEGEFEGNDHEGFECPDGKNRPAFIVSHERIRQARGLTVEYGKRNVQFRVLRRKKGADDWEFVRPPAPLKAASKVPPKKLVGTQKPSHPPSLNQPPPWD